MTAKLRVILEVGKKRRVVAGATDWPGLDRGGTSEENVVEKLVSYVPRYAPIAELAGRQSEFETAAREVDIIERVPGSSSTDFWGIAHVPSRSEAQVLPDDDLERRLELLQACWAWFDDVVGRVSSELVPSGRGGGRTQEQIVRHVYANEPEQMTRKVEVRTPREVVLTPDGLVAHRRETLAAIRAYNADDKSARTWPIQFLIRRIAHHVTDPGWELEDRDQGPPAESPAGH